MPDAVSRFSGIAAGYDAARPRPPAVIAEVLRQWARAAAPDVVDLGAGSGLSAMIWAGQASSVTAVEPGDDMRALAMQRLGLEPWAAREPAPAQETLPAQEALPASTTSFTVLAGTAEATGLPDACADIVTASQAMHWFNAERALPEIIRVLRPGGVFAAYDCDWPPCVDWETDAAYAAFADQIASLETARGLAPPHGGKRNLQKIVDSGLFRHAAEIAVHGREQGDARRLTDVALSQGGAAALLAAGATEEEMGLAALREVAARRLPGPVTWWWTYRIRMGVK